MMLQRINAHKINCDLQLQDTLFLGNGKSGWQAIEEEMEARKALGFIQTSYTKKEIKNIIGTDKYSGGVRYPET